jgi:1,4-alpha-glucan branching enzyme
VQDGFESPSKVSTRAKDGFESTPGVGSRGVAGTRATAAVSTTATPAQPAKRTITFVYDAGPHSALTDVKLKGSWDASGRFNSQWSSGEIPMRSLGNGKWEAQVPLEDDGLPRNWEWGVSVDGPAGNDQWAVMGEGNLKLDLSKPTASYAPTTYHQMGAQKRGNDVSFQFWAPDARDVQVKVTDKEGNVQRIPMKRAENGDWSAEVKEGFKALEGKSYVYEVVDSTGVTSDRPDPYAREMMGEQRGLDRLYLDPMRGKEVNRYFPGATELMRFNIDDEADADSAYLVLKDDSGKQLTRDELLTRLGEFDSTLIDTLQEGEFIVVWW